MARLSRRTDWGEEVGERLATSLEGKLSQRELARRLGVTDGAVSIWIAGGVPDAWRRLKLLCEAAEVSSDELLGLPHRGRGDRYPLTAGGTLESALAEPLGEWLRLRQELITQIDQIIAATLERFAQRAEEISEPRKPERKDS